MIAFDSRRFRVALLESGLETHEALGVAVGLSSSRITQIANGMLPRPEWRERIADALMVPAADLWPTCQPVEVR